MEVGLSINSSGVPLWSMASSSWGVAREKGIFCCFWQFYRHTVPFPRKLHQFWVLQFFVNFVLFSSTLIRAGVAVQGPLVVNKGPSPTLSLKYFLLLHGSVQPHQLTLFAAALTAAEAFAVCAATPTVAATAAMAPGLLVLLVMVIAGEGRHSLRSIRYGH